MRRFSWCLLLAGAWPCVASAQIQSLKEAAQQVVLTNPEVQARWHTFQAAEGERGVALGAMLPRVDVTAGVGRDRYDDPNSRADLRRRGTTVTLSQLLYDGFGSYNDYKRLDYARRVRLFELYDVMESAVLETARAYHDVMRYRALVALAEENYVRHRSVFEQIQRKTLAGVGRRVDLEQAAGRLALSESNLLTETANLHDVSARFQRLVGSSPRKTLEVSASLAKNLPASTQDALKLATGRHPALQAAIENVRSSERAASSRTAAFQPRFDLRVRSERGTNLGGVGGDTRNNIAEVVMSWNLFNGFSDVSRVRQFAEQLNVARDQRDKTCRDLRQTLAIAFNDIRKLKEQLTYLDQHQLAIEKARDAYRKQFDIGQRSLLDVLDTENELFQAKRAYVNADMDLNTAYARTHAAAGTLFTALGLTRADLEPAPAYSNSADDPQGCPAEGPEMYVADKAALNARAQELVREAVQAAADAAAAAQAGGAVPGQAPATPGATPGTAPGAVPGTAPVTPPAAIPPGAKSAAPALIEPADIPPAHKALLETLKAWTAAWGRLDIPAYLEFYSPNFKPANGVSREKWVAQRQAIMGAAKQVDLTVADPRIEIKEDGRGTTAFVQNYRSPSYRDVVNKRLEWEYTGGRWLIVRETAEAAKPAKR